MSPPTSHKGFSVFAPHQLCKGPLTSYKGFDDTRPWPAFGRQGLVGSSFEYSYTRLASRLRRSARSVIMTLGKDKTP